MHQLPGSLGLDGITMNTLAVSTVVISSAVFLLADLQPTVIKSLILLTPISAPGCGVTTRCMEFVSAHTQVQQMVHHVTTPTGQEQRYATAIQI